MGKLWSQLPLQGINSGLGGQESRVRCAGYSRVTFNNLPRWFSDRSLPVPAAFHFRRDFQSTRSPDVVEIRGRMQAYLDYLEANRDAIPPNFYRFAMSNLHDDYIKRVSWTGVRRLEIGMAYRPLVFDGVQSTNADWHCVEQEVYAHEVHPTKVYGLCEVVMILRECDLVVVAQDVAWL